MTSSSSEWFELSPRSVLVFLLCTVTFTATMYLTMSSFQEDIHVHNKIGAYGAVDADFDWCEHNHQLSPYLAEPWNSYTSLSYCVAALVAYHNLKRNLEVRVVLAMASLFMIGVGSFCFHGSLQYKMQLLDELPMVYLILTSVWNLYERNNVVVSSSGRFLSIIFGSFSAVVTVLLMSTPRDSMVHAVGRISIIFTFGVSFIYVFYAASLASDEFESLLQDKSKKSDMKAMFSRGFLCIMLALMSWIGDNMACGLLHKLPVYLQLHAVGWHLGTCLGVYYMIIAICIQRLSLRKYKYELVETPLLGGILKYPSVKQ